MGHGDIKKLRGISGNIGTIDGTIPQKQNFDVKEVIGHGTIIVINGNEDITLELPKILGEDDPISHIVKVAILLSTR